MKVDPDLPLDLMRRVETLGDALAKIPSVIFAYLFGSAAAGAMTPSSDIDIAAFLDPSVDAFDARLNVMAAASRYLGTDRLDVVILNAAPVSLAGRVLAGRRVILDRNPLVRHRYESLLIREFADFRLYERRHFARRQARGDRELVLRKSVALEGYLAELRQLQSLDLDAYRSDWKSQRIVERSLHLAIEVALDLADHLIADRGLRVPTTQADTFEILQEAGILEPALSQSLMQMARFRNLLVHDYARIDPEKVLKILQESLGDLDQFRRTVLSQV